MKSHHALGNIFIFALLLSINAQLVAATPYFNARSQSAHLMLEMVGQAKYDNRYNAEENYTNLSFVAPGFSQSFRADDIACCMFGPDLVKSGDCTQLTISGSGVSGRNQHTDWLADYFGLPSDFKSTVQFSPRVRNVIIDTNFYLGLDGWWHPGMFFKVHAPFVHTRWDLGFCERVCSKGSVGYPAGYFNSNSGNSESAGVAPGNLLNSFEEFAVECKTPNLNPTLAVGDTINPVKYPVVFKPLANARIAGCDCAPLTRNGLADLRFTLGYNAYMGDTYHVGFGLTGAAPTGNRPHGEYAFEPMVGNGNHWELGGEFTAHHLWWQSEDENSSLTAYLDAKLTHMFTTRQTRTFDLKDKPNSRYMLAQKMGTPVYILRTVPVQSVLSQTDAPAAQFKDLFMPVANLTTVDVDVNIGAQVDLVFMLNYTRNNSSLDFGYNLWARSCERIKLNCKCPNKLTDGKSWALKGDAHVYGFVRSMTGMTNVDVPLSATQTNATIHAGSNQKPPLVSGSMIANLGVDSPQYATSSVISELAKSTAGGSNNIFTSKDPNFLSTCDLDFDAAATKGLSHTLFTHFNYAWNEREGYVPFVGGGLSVEIADTTADCCKTTKSDCKKDCGSGCDRCGLSQWSLWLKGGFAFD